MQETQVRSLGGDDLLEKEMASPVLQDRATPVLLPGKSQGQRRLAGYSLWRRKRVGHDLGTKQQPQQMNDELVNE